MITCPSVIFCNHMDEKRSSNSGKVYNSDLLRGGDDDSSVDSRGTEVLNDGEMLVAGAGRRVHQQTLQLAPVYVAKKLLDQPIFLRPSPNDGVRRTGQEKADRHYTQIVFYKNGGPTRTTLVNLWKRTKR